MQRAENSPMETAPWNEEKMVVETVEDYEETNSSTETSRLLLELGAEVDTANSQGETALYFAASSGNKCLVRLFLKWKANLDCRTVYHSSALHIAMSKGHEEIAKLLLEHGASTEYLLSDVARRGDLVTLKKLASEGFDIKGFRSSNGWNLLHWAAHGGHGKMCRWLVESEGFDIESRDNNGATALHILARKAP